MRCPFAKVPTECGASRRHRHRSPKGQGQAKAACASPAVRPWLVSRSRTDRPSNVIKRAIHATWRVPSCARTWIHPPPPLVARTWPPRHTKARGAHPREGAAHAHAAAGHRRPSMLTSPLAHSRWPRACCRRRYRRYCRYRGCRRCRGPHLGSFVERRALAA